jgi:hypothetical protein
MFGFLSPDDYAQLMPEETTTALSEKPTEVPPPTHTTQVSDLSHRCYICGGISADMVLCGTGGLRRNKNYRIPVHQQCHRTSCATIESKT